MNYPNYPGIGPCLVSTLSISFPSLTAGFCFSSYGIIAPSFPFNHINYWPYAFSLN